MKKITNPLQLKQMLEEKIVKPLLEFLANKIEEKLRDNLEDADISTETMQKYVTHVVTKNTLGGGILPQYLLTTN